MNRPIHDDADAIDRMKAHSRKLRELNCSLAELPAEVLAEEKLLKAFIRKRVAQETSRVDQHAAALLTTIGDVPPTD